MTGKVGRSGRPISGSRNKVAYQVRLEPDEATALDALVERRNAEAAHSGAIASASGVLRAIVRNALLEEGLLPDTAQVKAPDEPKSKAKKPRGA